MARSLEVVVHPDGVNAKQDPEAVFKGHKIRRRDDGVAADLQAARDFTEKPVRIDQVFDDLAGKDQIEKRIVKGEPVGIQITLPGVDILGSRVDVRTTHVNSEGLPATRLPHAQPTAVTATHVQHSSRWKRLDDPRA